VIDQANGSPTTDTRCTDPAEFLRILHAAGDVFELRSYSCPIFKEARKLATASGYFTDPKEASRWARLIDDERQPPGVYATLNPALPDLLAWANQRVNFESVRCTKDEHVTRRNWLFLDIDPIKGGGLKDISATVDESNAAINLAHEIAFELEREGWPEPLRAMSGNGAYLLYRVDLPNDDESTELVKRVLHSLARRFDTAAATVDTTTYNASRILKIPGTTARKGDSIPDRPHRVAYFAKPNEPLAIVPVQLLQAVTKAPKPEPAAASQQANGAAHLPPQNGQQFTGSDAITRCRKYVANIPGAIQGQHGSNPTYQVACETQRFGLDDGAAMAILSEYNGRCVPPWSERELRHKLDEAKGKVTDKGSRLNNPPANGHPAGGQPHTAGATEKPGETRIDFPEPVTATDLIAAHPKLREPIIHGLARRGEVVNLIAAPKFGKSWLTYSIALSVVCGQRLFGKFLCYPGPVLILDNELHPETLASRLPLVADALGIDLPEAGKQIQVANLRGKLADLHAIGR
jgi:hypothetical protein